MRAHAVAIEPDLHPNNANLSPTLGRGLEAKTRGKHVALVSLCYRRIFLLPPCSNEVRRHCFPPPHHPFSSHRSSEEEKLITYMHKGALIRQAGNLQTLRKDTENLALRKFYSLLRGKPK